MMPVIRNADAIDAFVPLQAAFDVIKAERDRLLTCVEVADRMRAYLAEQARPVRWIARWMEAGTGIAREETFETEPAKGGSYISVTPLYARPDDKAQTIAKQYDDARRKTFEKLK